MHKTLRMPSYRALFFTLVVSSVIFAQAPPPREQSAPSSSQPAQAQVPAAVRPAQAPSVQPQESAPAIQSPTPAVVGGDIHGVVKAGSTPLPGATITAANTLTGKKISTSTGIDGSYSLHLASNGRYVIRAEMPAFAAATSEALINATNRDAKVDLNLMLA